MIRIKRDQITGIVLIVLGISIFCMVSQFKMPITAVYPGPRMLPSMAAFGFCVCGLGIFIQSIMSKKEEKAYMVKVGWIKMAILLTILAGYIFAMTWVGYLVATPITLFILTSMFVKGRDATLKGRIIFSVAVTLTIYVIYIYAFGLTLPSGLLFN